MDDQPTPEAAPTPKGDVDRPVELVLRFARAGHEAGYPTADLEERLLVLARAVGQADAQISATPTLVEVSLGSTSEQRSYTIRVRPSAVDLDAIARLDALVQDVVGGRLDAERALAARRDRPCSRRQRGRDRDLRPGGRRLRRRSDGRSRRGRGGLTASKVAARVHRSGRADALPGSAGFNSALQLLSNQTVSGISAAFDTFVTAMSIAYGLIISASLFPGKPPQRCVATNSAS